MQTNCRVTQFTGKALCFFFFWLHWELENILTHTLMSLTRATVEGPSKQGIIIW